MVFADKQYTMKQIRHVRGMTQQELADKVDLTKATIGMYEREELNLANAKYSTIQKIAKVLEVEVDDIKM